MRIVLRNLTVVFCVLCSGKMSVDGQEVRGHWSHPLDFLFSCISVSVGLGNVWWVKTIVDLKYKLFSGVFPIFAIKMVVVSKCHFCII